MRLNVQEKIAEEGEPRSPTARERAERLYLILRDRICLLDYIPGSRLSEEELAKEFKISRTPVRRVLARLESEGLVESRHGVGTLVTDVNIDELQQVYHLRMELALFIGKLSPLPRSAADVARIRALIAECEETMHHPDQRTFLHLNLAFFYELSAMTGNLPLREINERLYFHVSRVVVKMMPKLGLIAEFEAFRREMEEILAAAEIGDWESIGHIRRAHISMSFHRMMQYAGETGPGDVV